MSGVTVTYDEDNHVWRLDPPIDFMAFWQPIALAPQDGTRIIAYWPKYTYDDNCDPVPRIAIASYKSNPRVEQSYFSDNDEWDDYGLLRYPATHWMPLPEPPK